MNVGLIEKKCSGCMSCVLSCPFGAISMNIDEEGFLYPDINRDKCTDCGLCLKKCPVYDEKKVQALEKAYYGYSTDKEIVRNSSSGGIFSAIANWVIENDGIVFGAVFNTKTKEIEYRNTDETSLDELRRSKYVEANPKDVYIKVKSVLDTGRKVLFCGTGCHVAGLKKYLRNEYDNLLTCDFVCGGVPSSKIFKEYLCELEKKYKSTVKSINFRPKLYGWKEYSIKIDFENGKTYKNYASLDEYFRGYITEHAFVRESCGNCKFRTNHYSDIILADFWGYRQVENIYDDNTGLSLVVSNSKKGTMILETITKEKKADLKEIPLEYSSYNFKAVDKTQKFNDNKKRFMENYQKYGFVKAARKTYMKNCYAIRLKKLIKSIIRG